MRAIDGDRLKRKAQKVATEAWKMKIKASVETILNEFMDWIDDSPTIEPERKTGRWIHQVKFGRIECDQCGKVYRNAFAPKNYCPNCGARMED